MRPPSCTPISKFLNNPLTVFLVATYGQRGFKVWTEADSGWILYCIRAEKARYGHKEWLKEVASSHRMATDFAKGDTFWPVWLRVLAQNTWFTQGTTVQIASLKGETSLNYTRKLMENLSKQRQTRKRFCKNSRKTWRTETLQLYVKSPPLLSIQEDATVIRYLSVLSPLLSKLFKEVLVFEYSSDLRNCRFFKH